MKLRRISGFTGCIAALLCACTMHGQQPLATTINTLLTDPKIAGAHWGISVTLLDGTPIYALNDDKLFQPASNVKLFTTAAALAVFDPKSSVETDVLAYGVLTPDGHLRGHLTLWGDADANLSGRTLPYTAKDTDSDPLRYLDAMAAQIAQTGLTVLDGDVIGNDEHFVHQPIGIGWNTDDLPWGYAAPVSALSVNDNEVKLVITPGAHVDDPATVVVTPSEPAYYILQNNITTGKSSTPTLLNVDRPAGVKTVHLYGSIAYKGTPDVEYLSIDDPAEYAAMALKYLLVQHGVTVTGTARTQHRVDGDYRSLREETHGGLELPVRPAIEYWGEQKSTGRDTVDCAVCAPGETQLAGRILARHISLSLLDDVTVTNKVSQNLHAELLLRQMGVSQGDDGSVAQGARVVRQFAVNAGVKPDDFYFVDGSGLSNYDLATPRAFTQLLRYAATKPWGADYRSSLPIGGVDGTLEHRFTKPPLKGNVFAKTGTLSEDRALSGYLTAASGKTVVFSILSGDHLPGSTADRDVMDKIVAAIAAAN